MVCILRCAHGYAGDMCKERTDVDSHEDSSEEGSDSDSDEMDSGEKDSKSLNSMAIALGCIGAVVLILLAVLGACMCYRRSQQANVHGRYRK